MSAVREANGMLNLDADQIIRTQGEVLSDGTIVQKTLNVGGSLVPRVYDEISITYLTSGNGIGEIGTAVYKLNSVAVATLSLQYDGSNRLINVVKS